MLFERQPHSRTYVSVPLRRMMAWYYLRLLITVTPHQVVVREPFVPPPVGSPVPGGLPGADRLARHASAVLAARDASGAPVPARTRPVPADGGYAVAVPADCAAAPGPASLLVHRHDERISHMQNALVRGELRRSGQSWLLVPERVVEPMGSGRPTDAFKVLAHTRRATARYPQRRGLGQPPVQWAEFKALVAQVKGR
ncbi:hypothetical protein U5640_39215 [Streptomyces sp. SS7]|uniref:hypothetical protein n=1 Tax=Streptomyces sp. SS7 TaxID=3108485 RepID=UPI0030ED4F71